MTASIYSRLRTYVRPGSAYVLAAIATRILSAAGISIELYIQYVDYIYIGTSGFVGRWLTRLASAYGHQFSVYAAGLTTRRARRRSRRREPAGLCLGKQTLLASSHRSYTG
jgi:hypothetical protein